MLSILLLKIAHAFVIMNYFLGNVRCFRRHKIVIAGVPAGVVGVNVEGVGSGKIK